MKILEIDHGENDLLITKSGERYIDLISSTGAVFLGHANANINRHIVEQLNRLSCSWTSQLEIQQECKDRVGRHVDAGLSLYSLYSTGMEAAETAMRMAFAKTGRTGLLGFRNNNHGQSVGAINICTKEPGVPNIASFKEIPFLPDRSEPQILEDVECALKAGNIAAAFVEPIQGRGGGYAASVDFYSELQSLCRQHNSLVVCDEIFTGFYRTGPCFSYPQFGIRPDIVLIGKALSNGFPTSGILLDSGFDYHPKDFRFNSTFSDNPLACAAVIGSLVEMERINVSEKVANIESKLSAFADFENCKLRLHGAFCILQLAKEETAVAINRYVQNHNILMHQRGDILGLSPVATITPQHLDRVVEVTTEAFHRFV